MALPNFISGIFGVTEPAIYGILLPLKKPFIISCIAGCIGGGFYGAFNFRKFMMGGMGIFEFPANRTEVWEIWLWPLQESLLQ